MSGPRLKAFAKLWFQSSRFARIPERERAGEIVDRRRAMLFKARHARFGFMALGCVDHGAEHACLAAAAGVFDGGAARFNQPAAAARHAEARIEQADWRRGGILLQRRSGLRRR